MELIIVRIQAHGMEAGKIKFFDVKVTDKDGRLRKTYSDGTPLFETEPPNLLPDECVQRIADDVSKEVTQGQVKEFVWERPLLRRSTQRNDKQHRAQAFGLISAE